MNHHQHPEQRDELRARFTAWLDITIYHARISYLSKESNRLPSVSLYEIPEECLPAEPDAYFQHSARASFDFEEERLARAFANLPVQRQEILNLLFVEQLKPEEIAKMLNCKVQHVYDQRYHALKKLKTILLEEDES